jgi:hypothetical protein
MKGDTIRTLHLVEVLDASIRNDLSAL